MEGPCEFDDRRDCQRLRQERQYTAGAQVHDPCNAGRSARRTVQDAIAQLEVGIEARRVPALCKVHRSHHWHFGDVATFVTLSHTSPPQALRPFLRGSRGSYSTRLSPPRSRLLAAASLCTPAAHAGSVSFDAPGIPRGRPSQEFAFGPRRAATPAARAARQLTGNEGTLPHVGESCQPQKIVAGTGGSEDGRVRGLMQDNTRRAWTHQRVRVGGITLRRYAAPTRASKPSAPAAKRYRTLGR